MATIDVKDASGATVAVEKPLAPGRAAATASRPVALSNEDKTALDVLVTAAQDTTTPVPVVGPALHDAAISGAPVRLAGRALTADYTAVATGDTADLKTTLVGALIVQPYAIPEVTWSYAAASGGISNTTTAVTVKAAAAAGIRNYVTALQLSSDALGTATEFAIRDGAAGTVLWRAKIGTAGITGVDQIRFDPPLRGTAATLLEVVTLTASGTGAVFANLQGYTAP